MISVQDQEGNDVFEMARLFQKMYENALDDYTEVLPAEISNFETKREKNVDSFKEFVVLFNKIVGYSDEITFTEGLNPPGNYREGVDAALEDVQGLTPTYAGSKQIPAIMDRASGMISRQDIDYDTRDGYKKTILDIMNNWLQRNIKNKEKDPYVDVKNRVEAFKVQIQEEPADVLNDYRRTDMNKDSKLYIALTKLNTSIIEANEQMKKQYNAWNTSVLSGEIFLKREEIDSELKTIRSNLTELPLKAALHEKTQKNFDILEKYMTNIGSSNPVDVPATKAPGQIVHPRMDYPNSAGDDADEEEGDGEDDGLGVYGLFN